MCSYFSFIWDGGSNFLYFGWAARKDILAHPDIGIDPDSHIQIMEQYQIPVPGQEHWSRFSYNPFTGSFVRVYLAPGHKEKTAEDWVRNLDLDTIFPPVHITPLVSPVPVRASRIRKEDVRQLALFARWYINDERNLYEQMIDCIGSDMLAVLDDSVPEIWWKLGMSDVRSNCMNEFTWSVLSEWITGISESPGLHAGRYLWNRGFIPSLRISNDVRIWELYSGRHHTRVLCLTEANMKLFLGGKLCLRKI